MQVLTKPDRIGIWFYEGCIQLSNGLPFLLYISLRNLCNDDINDGAPEKVHYIVKQWVESITHFGINGVLLAFDSYYFSAATREYLLSKSENVKYCASVTCDKLKFAMDKLKTSMIDLDKNVNKPGDWHAIHTTATNETLTKVHDATPGVGVKHNMCNHLVRKARPNKSQDYKKIRGGYDTYKLAFSICDHFNRALKDRKWPFKCAPNAFVLTGERKLQYNMLFSCILENVFNLYDDVNAVESNSPLRLPFNVKCFELADHLFEHSLTV